MSDLVSKKEKAETLESEDLDKEVLLPSNEYISLIKKQKDPASSKNKKLKIFSILVGCLSAAALVGGITMMVMSQNKQTNKISITFNANGGTLIGSDTEQTDTKTQFKNINKPEVSQKDMAFLGWYFGPLSDAPKVEDNFNITTNTTLYAHWTPAPTISTITFDASKHGGEIIGSKIAYSIDNQTFGSINKPIAEKKVGGVSHAFVGWFYQTGEKAGQPVLDSDTINEDVIIEAQFSPSETITIKFNKDSESTQIFGNTEVSILAGQTFGSINCPTIYKDGFLFYDWYYKTESGVIVHLTEQTQINEPLDLYPFWIGTTLVHYDLSGQAGDIKIEHGYEYQYVLWNTLGEEETHFLKDVALPTITKDGVIATAWERKSSDGIWIEITPENDIMIETQWEVRPKW